jgi:predicted DNA-binding transcriptional regulator AlpA
VSQNESRQGKFKMADRAADQTAEQKSHRVTNQPECLLHCDEVSNRLGVSTSWLAKSRMRGDGPPYIRVGRSIRYSEAALLQWLKSRQRLSTSER